MLQILLTQIGKLKAAVSSLNSKIENEVKRMSVTFTYVNYNLWEPSVKGNYRIVQCVDAGTLITGDGYDFVRIFDTSSGALIPHDTSDTPVVRECIVVPYNT